MRTLLLLGLLLQVVLGQDCKMSSHSVYSPARIPELDAEVLQVPLNLEYLEAEFFLWGSLGHGLDTIEPSLAADGPAPRGAQKANLENVVRDVVAQFGYQEIGHLRALKDTLRDAAFSRPQLDLSKQTWAQIFDTAFGMQLSPSFDVYANSINYLLASYVIPYVGLTGYVGASTKLSSNVTKRLVAGLLGVESGQDAVIRAYLYQHATSTVLPYKFTVADATRKLSAFRSKLAGTSGVDDEGLVVPLCLGAEVNVTGNVLAGDSYSLSYSRTPEQVLAVAYASGNASCPGGFFPFGGSGTIASSLVCTSCECNPNRVPAADDRV